MSASFVNFFELPLQMPHLLQIFSVCVQAVCAAKFSVYRELTIIFVQHGI